MRLLYRGIPTYFVVHCSIIKSIHRGSDCEGIRESPHHTCSGTQASSRRCPAHSDLMCGCYYPIQCDDVGQSPPSAGQSLLRFGMKFKKTCEIGGFAPKDVTWVALPHCKRHLCFGQVAWSFVLVVGVWSCVHAGLWL